MRSHQIAVHDDILVLVNAAGGLDFLGHTVAPERCQVTTPDHIRRYQRVRSMQIALTGLFQAKNDWVISRACRILRTVGAGARPVGMTAGNEE